MLCVCAAPVLAGVLPDDRADVAVPPLRRRRHHGRRSLGPGAQEDRRQLLGLAQLLRGHDLERLDRREALGEPVQGDAQAGERRVSTTCTASPPTAPGYHHSNEPDYKAEHHLLLDQPGHVRRPDDGHPRLPARLGPGLPRYQGRRRPDRQRPDLPRARRSPRLLAVAEPDPHAQPDRELQLRAADRSGLSRQPLSQDPLFLTRPGRRLHARGPGLSQHAHQQRRLR